MYRISSRILAILLCMISCLTVGVSVSHAGDDLTSKSFTLDSSTFQLGSTSYKSGAKGNIEKLFRNIASALIVATGTLAALFIIMGGFYIIFSAGDPSKAAKGKTIIVMNAIAVILSLSAYLIINLVIWLLS